MKPPPELVSCIDKHRVSMLPLSPQNRHRQRSCTSSSGQRLLIVSAPSSPTNSRDPPNAPPPCSNTLPLAGPESPRERPCQSRLADIELAHRRQFVRGLRCAAVLGFAASSASTRASAGRCSDWCMVCVRALRDFRVLACTWRGQRQKGDGRASVRRSLHLESIENCSTGPGAGHCRCGNYGDLKSLRTFRSLDFLVSHARFFRA